MRLYSSSKLICDRLKGSTTGGIVFQKFDGMQSATFYDSGEGIVSGSLSTNTNLAVIGKVIYTAMLI